MVLSYKYKAKSTFLVLRSFSDSPSARVLGAMFSPGCEMKDGTEQTGLMRTVQALSCTTLITLIII